MNRRLVIRRTQAYEYTMPLNRGFGTSRGLVKQARNLLLVLDAEVDGAKLVGVGESATRSERLSGDTREGSWAFIQEAAEFLRGSELPIEDPDRSIQRVRELMQHLRSLADDHASTTSDSRPLRGTLSGIDMALLDVVAQGHDVSVADLLGKQREHPEISAATISSVRDRGTIERKTRAHAKRFPMNRIKAKGDLEIDLQTLRLVAETNQSLGVTKPLWLDVNEGFTPDEADRMIEEVATEIRAGHLPPHVILEQPVPKADGHHLGRLQRLADRRLRRFARRSTHGQITIMADESLWDTADLDVATRCAAINIKIQKVGGLLPALDLARAALERNPRIEIYLGGMLGTSDITCWAMQNLAAALPRLNYFTSVPPGNVQSPGLLGP